MPEANVTKLPASETTKPQNIHHQVKKFFQEAGVNVDDIKYPDTSHLPHEFNHAKFSAVDPDTLYMLQQTFDFCHDYLKRPLVKDNFAKHAQRHLWRAKSDSYLDYYIGQQPQAQFGELYKFNRLNIGSIFLVTGVTEIIRELNLPPDFPTPSLQTLHRYFISYIDPNSDRDPKYSWDHLPLKSTLHQQGKLEIVNEISQAVEDIINYLGKPNS